MNGIVCGLGGVILMAYQFYHAKERCNKKNIKAKQKKTEKSTGTAIALLLQCTLHAFIVNTSQSIYKDFRASI